MLVNPAAQYVEINTCTITPLIDVGTAEHHRPINGGGASQVPAMTPEECVVKA